MNSPTKNEQELDKRIILIEEAVFGSDKAETIIALCKGTFEGTSNLQEELVILKMQLENQKLKLEELIMKINLLEEKYKLKINEIITRIT